MTYSHVNQWANSGQDVLTLAVSPAVADGSHVLVLSFDVTDSGVTDTSSVSGGGVTTWLKGQRAPSVGSGNSGPVEVWWGVVTATGSATITIANSSVLSTDFTRLLADEFSSSAAGTWGVLDHNTSTGSGLSFSYPLLSGSGIYCGAANNDFGNLAAGSTSGCVYALTDNHLLTVYDLAASSDQPNGVTNDSGASITCAAILLAVTGGSVTFTPPRYGRPAAASPAPWEQRPYRSVPGTVDTPANPLASPLDTAWQAGGRHWHLYGDTAARDRRAYFTQRNYISNPSLLTTAELENELLGGADYGRQFLAATHCDRREVPPQPPRLADPALITTALLEGNLLGSADTVRHYTWFTDRREVPQQRPYVSDPSLLTAAELENELLGGGDVARHYLAAAYCDRREVPQQRAYASDPSFYPSGAPTDPLTVAWGDGGPYWHLYNRASDIADRREYFTQRPYQSGPSLLLSALLENELLGEAGTAQRYGFTAYYDRREVPQQRNCISDPSFYPSGAVTDPLALAWGAGGNYWHLYNRAADAMDRRQVPAQRAYASPPGLLAPALLENELLGGADDLARHRAWHADRREVPAQRPGTAPPDILADPLILGDDRARRLLAAGYWPRGWPEFQRLYFPLPAPPPPFSVGSLTAGTAPAATLTAASAPSATLTAGTAASSTLTATTQATGGPS